MDKSTNIIFIVIVVFAVLGMGAGIYFLFSKPATKVNQNTSDVVTLPKNPEKGDPGYQETNTQIQANESSRYSGNFAGIVENELNITFDENIISYALNEGEIALQCTDQKLAGVGTVNAEEVTDIRLTDKAGLETKMINGDPVFVLATEGEGKPVVHTIYVGLDVCERFE